MHDMLSNSPSVTKTICLHCGNPVPEKSVTGFCCAGCEAVFHWIGERGLERYYELKGKASVVRKPQPPSSETESFAYLDDPEFVSLHSWSTPEGRWMDFFLHGVHCSACVWLTEKLSETLDYVDFVRLNLGNSVATVRLAEGGTFAAIAEEFQRLGYEPRAVQRGKQQDFLKEENRSLLTRVGVAGACAGNIMLLAISLYGGADGSMAVAFRWLSLALFLPVVLYSATPFYQSAWMALRSKELSIDIPVVFGILLGAGVSLFNLLNGDDRIYFDSLSALVFLLLSTRYLLKRSQQSAFDSSRLIRFFSPSKFEHLSEGERVRVLAGEVIPVDGRVVSGESTLDCSLLTGESSPVSIGLKDLVFAGTVNLDAAIEIQVTQAGARTRLGRILESMEKSLHEKASISVFTDRVSRYFVAAVVLLSALSFAFGSHDGWSSGLNRALAIAIVTCPCTFALITPLAFSMTLGKLARAGVLVKGPEVLERLSIVKSVFLDKTGTLTFGKPRIIFWNLSSEYFPEILAIESQSAHPIARAIVEDLKPRIIGALPKVTEVKQILGQGISARANGSVFELKRAVSPATKETEVWISKDGESIGSVILSDKLRPDSVSAVNLLKSEGLDPWILSGDLRAPSLMVAQEIGVSPEQCLAEKSPEQKRDWIRGRPHSLMVGDGANDSIALAEASVGVAVHSGVEFSLRAADVYLRVPGVRPIYELIVAARETLHVVRRNLGLSLLYNFIAGGFAVFGMIDPLSAAFLMPLSALTVFVSTSLGTPKLRRAFKELGV